MKIKRAIAIILACTLLAGQAVYAQEGETEETLQEEVQEVIEEEEKDVTEEKGEAPEEGETEQKEETERQNREDISSDSINNDGDTADGSSIENTTGNSETAAQSGIEPVDLNIYQGYDLVTEVSMLAVKVHVSDESVANIELIKGESNTYIKFQALKPGNTYVELIDDAENVIGAYHITSVPLPEDAVPIEDIVLRSRIVFDTIGVDANRDGYISKEELAKATYIRASGYAVPGYESVKSLSGMEYAVNLKTLYLENNEELTDIDALFQLTKLEFINLTNTNVSDEDRWKLADFGDIECAKGNGMDLLKGRLFEEEVSVEAVENEGVLDIEWTSIRGLKEGTARLRISYKNFSKEITVTVNGINYDQEVGEAYTEELDLIDGTWYEEGEGGTSGTVILRENGELWATYPELRKIKDNAKRSLLGVVYGESSEQRNILYVLDKNNTLWEGEKQIAEDVVDFDEYYALNSRQELTNLHTGEVIQDVRKWCANGSPDRTGYRLYVLKSDGNLYGRKDDHMNSVGGKLEKLKEQVKEMRDTSSIRILCEDGSVYDYENLETPMATGIESFLNVKTDLSFLGIERISACLGADGSLWVCGTSSVYGKYVNVGKLDAAEIVKRGCRYGENYGDAVLILTQSNELYAYKENAGLAKIDSDVRSLGGYFDSWDYQKSDGEYYDIEGEQGKKLTASKETPLLLYSIGKMGFASGEYYGMYRTGTEEDNIVTKDEMSQGMGVEILNHVERIWRDHDRGYALRTDGTIWDITDVPKMIFDLKTSTYVKGDVNEDGEVNIKDLQLILRGVCEKIELTERQIMIADVVKDGKVDIQDLRKELRFVCGKITEL